MIKLPSERQEKLQTGSARYAQRPMQEGNAAMSAQPAKRKVIEKKTAGLKTKEIEVKAWTVKKRAGDRSPEQNLHQKEKSEEPRTQNQKPTETLWQHPKRFKRKLHQKKKKLGQER